MYNIATAANCFLKVMLHIGEWLDPIDEGAGVLKEGDRRSACSRQSSVPIGAPQMVSVEETVVHEPYPSCARCGS